MKRLDYPGTVEVLYTRPQLTHAVHRGTQRPPVSIQRTRYSTRNDGIRRDPAHIAGARSIPVTTRRYDYDAHVRAVAGEMAIGPTLDEQRRETLGTMRVVVLALAALALFWIAVMAVLAPRVVGGLWDAPVTPTEAAALVPLGNGCSLVARTGDVACAVVPEGGR